MVVSTTSPQVGFASIYEKPLKYLVGIVTLRDKQFSITLPYFQSKEVVHEAHVLHLELSFKVLLERSN